MKKVLSVLSLIAFLTMATPVMAAPVGPGGPGGHRGPGGPGGGHHISVRHHGHHGFHRHPGHHYRPHTGITFYTGYPRHGYGYGYRYGCWGGFGCDYRLGNCYPMYAPMGPWSGTGFSIRFQLSLRIPPSPNGSGFADGRRYRRLLVRIARKLSKPEPAVLLRNFPSGEQIKDKARMG